MASGYQTAIIFVEILYFDVYNEFRKTVNRCRFRIIHKRRILTVVTAKKLEEDVLTYLHNHFILIDKAMSDFRNGTLSAPDTYYIGLEYFIFLSFVIKRSITLSDIFSSGFKASADKLMAQKTQEFIDSVDAYCHMNKISLSELQDKRFPVYSRIFDCGYSV